MTWLILFWGAVAFVAYTYAGYPLLLGLLARLRPRPPRRDAAYAPSVAIVVVAYNEAARIAAKIESCLAQSYRAAPVRVVVASDGSGEEMHAVVRGYADRGVTLLPFAQRRGKAACLNDAVAACDEEVIVFTDARQRLDPKAVARLVAVLGDARYGAVSGELVFEKDDASAFGDGVDAYWRYEKFIRKSEAVVGSVVGVTGALYALKRRCFRPIPSQTILDDVAIPMQVAMQRLRVGFEPGAIAYDRPAQEVAQERVRKVRTLAGNYQLVQLYPALLSPLHNPLFLGFVSHKLCRLLAPLAMLICLLASAVLAPASGFFLICLVVQLLGYALAWAGGLPGVGERFKLARIAHAFVVLNWFAVLGFKEFLVNRQAHLWRANVISAPPGPGQ